MKRPIDVLRATIQVRNNYLETAKKLNSEDGINFGLEMLEDSRNEAITLLSSMGYKVDSNNLDYVLNIAYYEECKKHKFSCTYVDFKNYAVVDNNQLQGILTNNGITYFYGVLKTLKGHKTFTIILE